jgi:hypothetical protein
MQSASLQAAANLPVPMRAHTHALASLFQAHDGKNKGGRLKESVGGLSARCDYDSHGGHLSFGCQSRWTAGPGR